VVSAIQAVLACIDYTASNGNTVQYEMEWTCKVPVVAHIKIPFRHVFARTLGTASSLGRIRSLDRYINPGSSKYESTLTTIIWANNIRFTCENQMVIMIMTLFRDISS
jgi:hypothetical protein